MSKIGKKTPSNRLYHIFHFKAETTKSSKNWSKADGLSVSWPPLPPPKKKEEKSVKHAEGRVRYLFAEGRVRHSAFFRWPAFKENEKSKCMPRRPKNQYVK